MSIPTFRTFTTGLDATIELGGTVWRGPGVNAAVATIAAYRATDDDPGWALSTAAASTAMAAFAALVAGRSDIGFRQAQLAVALRGEAALHGWCP